VCGGTGLHGQPRAGKRETCPPWADCVEKPWADAPPDYALYMPVGQRPRSSMWMSQRRVTRSFSKVAAPVRLTRRCDRHGKMLIVRGKFATKNCTFSAPGSPIPIVSWASHLSCYVGTTLACMSTFLLLAYFVVVNSNVPMFEDRKAKNESVPISPSGTSWVSGQSADEEHHGGGVWDGPAEASVAPRSCHSRRFRLIEPKNLFTTHLLDGWQTRPDRVPSSRSQP